MVIIDRGDMFSFVARRSGYTYDDLLWRQKINFVDENDDQFEENNWETQREAKRKRQRDNGKYIGPHLKYNYRYFTDASGPQQKKMRQAE